MFKISMISGVALAAVLAGSAFAQSANTNTTTTSHPALTDQQLADQLVPAVAVVAGQLQPVISAGTQAGQRGQAVSQQAAPQTSGQASSPAAAATAATPQVDLMGEINQGLKLMAASPHS